MAFFDDIFEGWASAGLVGVGVILAAPTLVPIVGAMVRPLTNELGRGFLLLTDTVRDMIGETGEGLRDMAKGTRPERVEEWDADRPLRARNGVSGAQGARANGNAQRRTNRRNQRARHRPTATAAG